MSSLLWLILWLTAGCSEGVQYRDLPGDYRNRGDYTEEHLLLFDSGLFRQSVRYQWDGLEVTASGTWRYNADRGYIVFEKNFFITKDVFGQITPRPKEVRGIVILPVRKVGSNIRIGSEEGLVYVKEANAGSHNCQ
jgi:hypothetical protein